MSIDIYKNQILYIESIIELHKNKILELQNTIENLNNDTHEICDEPEKDSSLINNLVECHIDDQNNIWDRVRNAHDNQMNMECNTVEPETEPVVPVETEPEPVETVPEPVETVPEPVETLPEPVEENYVKKNVIINKFSKYTNENKLVIMANIFKQAKSNIHKLSLIDDEISKNKDANIQKEADRLLILYLSKN